MKRSETAWEKVEFGCLRRILVPAFHSSRVRAALAHASSAKGAKVGGRKAEKEAKRAQAAENKPKKEVRSSRKGFTAQVEKEAKAREEAEKIGAQRRLKNNHKEQP